LISLKFGSKNRKIVYLSLPLRLLFLPSLILSANYPDSKVFGADAYILIVAFLLSALYGWSITLTAVLVGDVAKKDREVAGIITQYMMTLGLLLGSLLSSTLAVRLV
jgi:MFS family permease